MIQITNRFVPRENLIFLGVGCLVPSFQAEGVIAGKQASLKRASATAVLIVAEQESVMRASGGGSQKVKFFAALDSDRLRFICAIVHNYSLPRQVLPG